MYKKEVFWVCYYILRCQFVRNLLSGKGIVRAGSGNKKGEGTVRAGYEKQWDF